MQGRIAGVQVQNIDPEAGSDPKVQVRGLSSLNAGASPLVVVDGHPVPDGLAFVNMSDVESVEVLKDAASAAIYGSRGASGVILITTKSGKAQKPKFNLKVSWGIKNPYKLYPILTTTEYTQLLYDEAALRFADTAWTKYASTSQINAKGNLITPQEKGAYLLEKNFFNGVPTDWQEAAIRPGNVQNVDLSISGGSKEVKYYIAGAYQNDQGMMLNSEYQRFNVRSKIDAQISKKLKLTINLNPSYFKRERPSTNFTDFARVTSYLPLVLDERSAAFVRQASNFPNAQPGDFAQPRMFNDLPYNGIMPDGSTFTSNGVLAISSSANNSPYSVLKTRTITSDDFRVLSSADLSYTFTPELVFKTLLSAYVNYTSGLDFAKSNSNRQGDVSRGVYTTRLFTDLLNENTLTYTKQIKKHNINFLGGFTVQKRSTNFSQTTGLNYLSDNVTTLNTAQSIDIPNSFSSITKVGLLSYLARATYSFDNKYLFMASIRSDGSSKFGPGNKWGSFPALSLGWVASKENFLKNVSWLNNLKYRISAGAVGNNDIQDFLWTDQLYLNNFVTGAGTGTTTGGILPSSTIQSNPDITWERTFSYNAGVDVAILKNAVNFSVDVYQTETEKLLLQQAALGFTGVPSFINNIGRIKNIGIEFEITSNNIRNRNFKWSTSFNIARTYNKLTELGLENLLLNVGERVDGYISKIGSPAIQYYGFKTDGIWNSQNDINIAVAKGAKSTLSGYFTPGALKFVDINGDNTIDLNDRTVIGNPYPDFTWGITNSFNYKDFDLSFTFQGVQGGQVMNGDGFYNEARKYNNAFIANRWISPANPGDGKTPYFTNGYTNAWTQSDYLIRDASYFALRDLLIGYTMPTKWATKIKLNSFRVYCSAQNLSYVYILLNLLVGRITKIERTKGGIRW